MLVGVRGQGWPEAIAKRRVAPLRPGAGADLRWIQKAMGHESITTTARISAHLYDDELHSVAAALDRIGRGE